MRFSLVAPILPSYDHQKQSRADTESAPLYHPVDGILPTGLLHYSAHLLTRENIVNGGNITSLVGAK